jgi:hypothetical protein
MPETAMTYGQLDEALRSLGFAPRTLEGKARIYKHEATGATVILPDALFGEAVLPHHLIVVRTVLREHDFADPTDSACKVQGPS